MIEVFWVQKVNKYLMWSYILAASMELALVMHMYRTDNSWIWAFGFLMLDSILSLAVDNTDLGEGIRKEMREQGIQSEKYDLIGNICRIGAYVLTFTLMISAETGASLAYLGLLISTIAGMVKRS